MNIKAFPFSFCFTDFSLADSPFHVEKKFASRQIGSLFSLDGEWMFHLGREFEKWELSLENVLATSALDDLNEDWNGVLSLESQFPAFEFVRVGPKLAVIYGGASAWAAGGVLTFSWNSERIGFEFSDENEYAYHIPDQSHESLNTLNANWNFWDSKSFSLSLFLENEVGRILEKDEEWEDVLNLGPKRLSGNFSIGLFYSPTLLPDWGNGVKLTLGHSF